MNIGFDLHNIRDGGGPNYIRNLIEAADPKRDGFAMLHLFGSPKVLDYFPEKPFVRKHGFIELGRSLPFRTWFIATKLPHLLREFKCDILYSPGGIAFGNFRPYATISRNMMPFSPEFWGMYPIFSGDRARLHLLRWLNAATFARADGMIYLTETARRRIEPLLGANPPLVDVIAHGVDHERFKPTRHYVKPQLGAITRARIIYPSRLEPYKHQVEVIHAFADHLPDFPNLRLELCGPANPTYLEAVEAAIRYAASKGREVVYLGELSNSDLPSLYAHADILVFASACENLPNILIEAMASAIPICCSSRSPMPEVAQDACNYFDPADPVGIATAIREVLNDQETALKRTQRAAQRAQQHQWMVTAQRTFAFLGGVAKHRRDIQETGK